MIDSVHFESRFKIANKRQLAVEIGSAATGSALIATAAPVPVAPAQANAMASMIVGFVSVGKLLNRIADSIFDRCFSKDKAAPQEPKAAAAPETKDTPAKPTP